MKLAERLTVVTGCDRESKDGIRKVGNSFFMQFSPVDVSRHGQAVHAVEEDVGIARPPR
jgi:hypothetical protein